MNKNIYKFMLAYPRLAEIQRDVGDVEEEFLAWATGESQSFVEWATGDTIRKMINIHGEVINLMPQGVKEKKILANFLVNYGGKSRRETAKILNIRKDTACVYANDVELSELMETIEVPKDVEDYVNNLMNIINAIGKVVVW